MLHRFALALGFTFFALLAHAEAPPWAHELSDLPPDPGVRWGRLENGVRYAVSANADTSVRASLRLIVLAGTVHETDRQRGYAHFVEHLAFLGSRRYPGQTLHAELQREGIARGPDVNAYTHPGRTVYRLDLSSAQPERLRRSLEVLREFADGLTFGSAEVERERNVILVEKALRDSPAEHAEAALLRFLFPASALAEANGFGTESSIRNASAPALREFHETWYRADNLVVVAVGAFDAGAVEQQIASLFGTLATTTTPRPAVAFGPIANPPELRVGVTPAAPGSNVVRFTLVSIAPALPADTRASMVELLRRTIAFDILNRRLDAVQHDHPDHLAFAGASLHSGAFYRQAQLRVDCSRTHWRRGLQTAERELRRALEHGFTPAEMEESRAKISALISYSAKAESTRQSEFQADALVESIAENRVFLAAGELAALSAEALAEATPATCLAAFRQVWTPGQPQLFVTGNFAGTQPEADMAKAYRRSARKRLKPPVSPRPVMFAYGDFGRDGQVVARRHIPDIDLHCVQFANGVLLNLKPTRFEAHRIVYGVRLGTGASGEPPDLPGLRFFADAGLGLLGLGRHDEQELSRLAAGHLASLSFATGEEAFYVSGLSDSAGAERLMQLLTAHLTDPGWRKNAMLEIQQRMLSRIEEITQNPTSHLGSRRLAKLARDDSRYSLPAPVEVVGFSLADLRAWIEPQLERGPLEIGVVGDFDVEAMIKIASQTIGCLPARRPFGAIRPVSFARTVPPTAVVAAPTATYGVVQLTWAVPTGRTVALDHRLELLGEVLRNRLIAHIRGELGATYSTSTQLWRSEIQPETGYLIVSLNCQPADVERVASVARQIADALAREGVTGEEFERARQPRLQNAASQLRTNSIWLSTAVAAAQTRPDQLDWPRQRTALLEQITAAEVSGLAAEVLPAARASVFTAAPAKP